MPILLGTGLSICQADSLVLQPQLQGISINLSKFTSKAYYCTIFGQTNHMYTKFKINTKFQKVLLKTLYKLFKTFSMSDMVFEETTQLK